MNPTLNYALNQFVLTICEVLLSWHGFKGWQSCKFARKEINNLIYKYMNDLVLNFINNI